MSANPMVTIPKRGSEFWNRIQTWLDNKIHEIKTKHLTPNVSSKGLLDLLGLRRTPQIQNY